LHILQFFAYWLTPHGILMNNPLPHRLRFKQNTPANGPPADPDKLLL